MVEYKARLIGIDIVLHEESYTSVCSSLDNEPVEKHAKYRGKRVRRGLFRSSKGQIINADVNAGYNIVIKAIPEAFRYGIEGLALTPYSLGISNIPRRIKQDLRVY